MIKGWSAGIGDILRSSASWKALKNKFPQTDLYLIFFTKNPGYVSEPLISRHHLLKGFFVIDKRTKGLKEWIKFLREIGEIAETVNPDLIIDFEPHGLRTSIVSLLIRLKYRISSIGVNEVPLRGLFYSLCSVSTKKFAKKRSLDYPLNISYRDFVALSALEIERNGIPIELEETSEGKIFRTEFRNKFGIHEDAGILGVNIGCGTPDALHKRPDLKLLSSLVGCLQREYKFTVVLTGAEFEKGINEEFIGLHSKNHPDTICDLAGKTSLLELTGFIKGCNMFVSTDSGPYHMAVALRVPTIAVFNENNKIHFHYHPWVRCVVMLTEADVAAAINKAAELLKDNKNTARLNRTTLCTEQ